MANLNITTIQRPKLPRNKYGYTNNGQVIIGGSSYSGGSGGGGEGSGEIYQDFTGATAQTNGLHGLVPAPSRGQQNYILHGSGNWRQLFGGHLQYDEATGTFLFDSSVQGTFAKFNDVSVLNSLESLLIKSTTGNFNTVNSSTNNTNIINASTGNIHDINASTGNINLINAHTGYIDELHSEDIFTKNLTVTGLAHFFELIIDRIRSAGGSILLTPADGFKVEKVSLVTDGYKLYWSAKDEDRAIYNNWVVNDQAISMSFNRAQVGVNYNISNKYFWSLVTGVGTETIDGEDFHYIIISTTTFDGEVNPEIGDEIVMLGSRTNDVNRQNAIYISAYSGLDTTLQAPFWCQYTGINDFNLSTHKKSWFAANGNHVQGTLVVETGESIYDLLDDIETKTNVDIHVYSDKGSTLLVGERSFTLYAEVWYNNIDITANIPPELFSWEKKSEDTQADNLFNISHTGIGPSVNLTDTDVTRKANFCCVINIDELKRRNIIQ